MVLNKSMKQKKGKKGSAAQYLTRTQALRKLQLSLPEFRRLCILKGIHPREPRKKPKGANKTYYHVKDLAFLLHEPLLEVFRHIKAYQRKVNKAKAKQQLELAEKLCLRRPQYTLDKLVRERYPSFVDAVRDIDDPLCIVNLFSALPASKGYKIPVDSVHNSRKLSLEWQAYVVRAGCLKKVFVAVKGFYYQAEVCGQTVTWLVPHERSQVLPADVDYRVMVTFLEFYQTMLKFVFFKLYHDVNLKYPPALDADLESNAAGLNAVITEGEGAALDEEEGAGEVAEGEREGGLFDGMVFFLSRETPRESLTFVIRSLGGSVGWEGEGSKYGADHPSITHHVVDRPKLREEVSGREYVQPQWVYDSVNFGVALPVDLYGVGKKLPPHLSPFVDDEAEGYTPDYAKFVANLKSGEEQSIPSMKAQNLSKEEAEERQEQEDEARYRTELEAEVSGKDVKAVKAGSGAGASGERDEDDEEEMEGMVMTRKDRKLYEAIQKSKTTKRERAAKLTERRKKNKTRK
ncbi:ribosome biogenesis pescadillo-like protein [Chloropicon roscoffensis]|uniref:Pescadillo homolog n=2 Tax=Chloropicon roscoffensis TaxID=1461544 RepID=A0AAX4P9T9_9CHLO